MSEDNSIQIVKLINGEELIGAVKYSAKRYTVRDPERIVSGIAQNGSINVLLMDYTPFSKDESVVFDENHVLYICTPNDDMRAKYVELHAARKAQKTGIFVPPKPKLELIQ